MSLSAGHPRALFARLEHRLKACSRPNLVEWIPTRIALSGPALLREIRQASASLRHAGVRSEDRVLLALTHPLTTTLLVPALWKMGGIPLLAEPPETHEEMARLMERLSPDHAITDSGALHDSAPLWQPGLPLLAIRGLSHGPRLALPRGTVLVRTTSGSSGPAKAAAFSGDQLLIDTRNILAWLRLGERFRGLGAISLSHAYGFSTLLIPLLFHQLPLTLLERPLPEQFRAALSRDADYFFPGVPYLYDLLLRAEFGSNLLRRLRLCLSAGSPLPSPTAARFRAGAGVPIRNLYGSSECGTISCEQARRGTPPPGCVGRPLPGIRVQLKARRVGSSGQRVGRDPSGQILVQSETVALAYVTGRKRPRLLRGRHLTGDLGWFDGRGRLFLGGRVDRVINVAGRKVRPQEVEEILIGGRGIREAVAFGIPDPARGEVVAAAVASFSKLSPTDLLVRCRSRLSPHKVPHRVEVLRELPRTARGKIDFSHLRALVACQPPKPSSHS